MSKTTEVHQKIAKNIQRIRKEKTLSQEELAHKAGLNRAYVGYIERGERKPSVDTLDKISKALKIKLQDLFLF
jgi:transcriptional regulator with XRE-family HTH domain